MTENEAIQKIRQGMEQIETNGCSFGRIELVIRDGEIKHVNVSYEINTPLILSE